MSNNIENLKGHSHVHHGHSHGSIDPSIASSKKGVQIAEAIAKKFKK